MKQLGLGRSGMLGSPGWDGDRVEDSPARVHGHEDEVQERVLPSQARLWSLPRLPGWCMLGQNLDFCNIHCSEGSRAGATALESSALTNTSQSDFAARLCWGEIIEGKIQRVIHPVSRAIKWEQKDLNRVQIQT